MLKTKLLDILCCPKCKGELKYDEPNKILICELDKLRYPIKGNIPVLLVGSKIDKIKMNEH